jgi:hypothetical protein
MQSKNLDPVKIIDACCKLIAQFDKHPVGGCLFLATLVVLSVAAVFIVQSSAGRKNAEK